MKMKRNTFLKLTYGNNLISRCIYPNYGLQKHILGYVRILGFKIYIYRK